MNLGLLKADVRRMSTGTERVQVGAESSVAAGGSSGYRQPANHSKLDKTLCHRLLAAVPTSCRSR